MFELLWISVPTARCFLQHHELLTDWQINNKIWRKILKASLSWLFMFFHKKDFLKVSFAWLSKICLEFSWTTGWWFDFSWSGFCCWQNNFWLLLVCILLNLDLFLFTFVKWFFFFFCFFWENYRGDKNYARLKI